MKHPHPRAFFMLDAVTAVVIAGALLVSFSLVVGNLHRSQRTLADQRAADRRLEDNLIALQNGGKAEPELVLERLPGSLAGRAWVRLSTPPGQKPRAALVGLVPASAAPGGAP